MGLDEIFRLIVLAYLLAIMGTRVYFLRPWVLMRRQRSQQPGWREFIRRQGWGFVIFSALVGVWLAVALLLYLLPLPGMAWTHLPVPDWVFWMGLILGIGVFPFHVWVHQTLGNTWTPTGNGGVSHQLVTEGPYRSIRHPMFVTTAVVLVAVALMASDLFLWIGVGGMIILMVMWAHREEQRLLEEFGDQYRAYMQRTGRFIPKRHKKER